MNIFLDKITRLLLNKANIFRKIIVGKAFLLSIVTSVSYAADNGNIPDLFQTTNAIKLTIEETIPENCPERSKVIAVLKSTSLTIVKTDLEAESKEKQFGYSFPTATPWCLLAAKYIKSLSFRPKMGDWGCGHGFFSRHAIISGANPYAIDSSLEAATEANKIIFGCKSFFPLGLKITDHYKVSNVSVVNPGFKFINRQNHLNVAFNIIHYLSPPDADSFLKNIYNNTLDGGIIILCCDTPFYNNNPFDHEQIINYYNERKEKGIKYPGYGVYNQSTVGLVDAKHEFTVYRSVSEVTDEEEKSGKFQMGVLYEGIYPLHPSYDNGQTIIVSENFPDRDISGILAKLKLPYYYATGHQTFNLFDYEGLKNVLELSGFTVINGWYTDSTSDTLYHHDDCETYEKMYRSKVVIVAQKNKGNL